MAMDLETELNQQKIPDDWLAIIIHYVMGMHNETYDFSEPILKPVVSKIYPIFIIIYGLLALFGILTNIAIIIYIMRYKLYRDVTHAFIVNLAFCHFVQCAIELPITLMVLLIQNWIFGQFWCFFLPLLQDIPLHVAMITHLLIAWDRMRWLGDPLKTRIPAFVCSCATWLTGMVIALPYPIYTTYLDLGIYMKQFRGVGICAVNLVDDMQEYMRGLFVIMYCAPMTILAYLYIRTSRELRPPEGPIAVMMFEARADARNRQRTSSSSSGRQIRTDSNRSYDLYDAELDVTREKRTQRHLGGMAATQVICVCPLMVMKLARMALVETYDNAAHFDITYLMFVWIAFLPTAIVPGVYASWVLSRPAKERLLGYFRLSSRRNKETLRERQSTTENNENDKIIKENIITTKKVQTQNDKTKQKIVVDKEKENLNSNHKTITDTKIKTTKTIQRTSTKSESDSSKPIDYNKIKRTQKQESLGNYFVSTRKLASMDPLTNSCSNITSSTYCNNGSERRDSNCRDVETPSSLFYTDHSESSYDKKPLCNELTNKNGEYFFNHGRPSFKKNFNRTVGNSTNISDREIMSSKGSTSTLEHDLEIIDMLERERSMDIQEMIAKERREQLGKHQNISRQASISERRRKLPEPDYSKLSLNISSKLSNSKDLNIQFSSHRYSPTIGMRDRSFDDTPSTYNASRRSSRGSHGLNKHDSFTGVQQQQQPDVTQLDHYEPISFDSRMPDHRLNRQRSNSSHGSSNSHDHRFSAKDLRETNYNDDL